MLTRLANLLLRALSPRLPPPPPPSPPSSPPQTPLGYSAPSSSRTFLIAFSSDGVVEYTYCNVKGDTETIDKISIEEIDARTRVRLLLGNGIAVENMSVRELTPEELNGA